MYPENLSYALQPSGPPFPTTLPNPLFPHQFPPPLHPETYTYNTDWGPVHQQAFLSNLNQMNSGQPSSFIPPPANNSDYTCRWLIGGGPCNQILANFDDLMVHLGDVHDVRGSDARKLICQWLKDGGSCGKGHRRDAFRRHIGVHLGLSVSCPHCGKAYSRADSMRAHVKKQHVKK